MSATVAKATLSQGYPWANNQRAKGACRGGLALATDTRAVLLVSGVETPAGMVQCAHCQSIGRHRAA
jgi:hypothetical protein